MCIFRFKHVEKSNVLCHISEAEYSTGAYCVYALVNFKGTLLLIQAILNELQHFRRFYTDRVKIAGNDFGSGGSPILQQTKNGQNQIKSIIGIDEDFWNAALVAFAF